MLLLLLRHSVLCLCVWLGCEPLLYAQLSDQQLQHRFDSIVVRHENLKLSETTKQQVIEYIQRLTVGLEDATVLKAGLAVTKAHQNKQSIIFLVREMLLRYGNDALAFQQHDSFYRNYQQWAAKNQDHQIIAELKEMYAVSLLIHRKKKALEVYQECFEYCQKHKLFDLQVFILSRSVFFLNDNKLGGANYELALAYAIKAAELAEKYPVHNLAVVNVLLRIAETNYHTKNYDKTIELSQRALNLSQDSTSAAYYRVKINLYTILGLSLRELKRYPQALICFIKALKIAESSDDLAWIGICEGNIGSVYLLEKNYPKATEHYKRNIEISSKTNETFDLLLGYLRLAEIYLNQNEVVRAGSLLDSAKQLTDRKAITLHQKYHLQLLLKYQILNNDYQNALLSYQRFIKINDSLFHSEKQALTLRIQAEYDFKQKEKEIEHLNQDNELQNEVIKRQNQIGIAFIFIVLIGLLFSYYLFRNNLYRKRINERLALSYQRLEDANKTKDKLFSIIGHDLRSPIASLKGILDLLVGGELTPSEFRDVSMAMQQQVNKVYFLLDNLLHWAYSQRFGITTKPSQISLNEFTQERINLYQLNAYNKNIQLKFIPCSVQVWVEADADHLSLVLRNLLNNAIKFTPKGGQIEVSVRAAQNMAIVEVADTGVGISETKLANLFANNKNNSSKGTSGEKGMGLGLMLCKEFIEKNNGTIWVKSKPNMGSIFAFTLPLTELTPS